MNTVTRSETSPLASSRETATARFAPYALRIVLVLAAILLARIGGRYIVDPVGAVARDGIILQSTAAITAIRVSFGAFPLAAAIFGLGSVFVSRALTAGVALVATVMATALSVRVYDFASQGTLPSNLGPIVGEGVLLVLAMVALAWDRLSD